MRCGIFFLILSLQLCSWAQDMSPVESSPETPLDSSGLTMEFSKKSSPVPIEVWTTLDELLSQLETTALNLNSNSAELRNSLLVAQNQLTLLSQELEQSKTTAERLSSSLEQSQASLRISDESLNRLTDDMERKIQENEELEGELWVWRIVAALGCATTILALVF